MFKFIFDLFGETVWYKGFVFTEVKNIGWYFAVMLGIAFSAYILGSVNSAVIFSKLMYGEDIRTKGSGNAGMTNMMRNYGKGPAALTLVCDMLKTLVAMAIGTALFGINGAYIAGLFAIVGHVLPVFYGFKGGKGVASTAMVILYLNPIVFLILFLLFVLIVWSTKYLSLGSVICVLLFPLLMNRFDIIPEDNILRLILTLIIAGIVFFKHRTNISRIMSGTESKFSFKKTAKRPKADETAEAESEEEAEVAEAEDNEEK